MELKKNKMLGLLQFLTISPVKMQKSYSSITITNTTIRNTILEIPIKNLIPTSPSHSKFSSNLPSLIFFSFKFNSLTPGQRKAIVSTLENIFGKNCKIYLFGSRVDDTKKGGDIDLLVITDKSLSSEELIRRKLKALAELYKKLGERKIDLLVTDYPQKEIEKIAVQTGILLNK